MPTPIVNVLLGADIGLRDPNTFILDDPVRGLLNSSLYTLSGDKLFDITDRVRSVSTKRGKSTSLDRMDAGTLSIQVDNSDRLFDPLYVDGTFYGQLIPGKEIRISSNDIAVIWGFVDDLNISYEPGNRSTVTFQATDALGALTRNDLPQLTTVTQRSGQRVNVILDLPTVNWPADNRAVSAGNSFMLDSTIQEGTSAIAYLQTIATSEVGEMFVNKANRFVFRARNASVNSGFSIIDVMFTDEASVPGYTTIPFTDLGVVYGTEELYNRVVVSNSRTPTPDEAVAEDFESQILYGPRTYTQTGLLNESTQDLQYLADFLLARFKEPKYRFDSLTVSLDTLPKDKQDDILGLELTNIVEVRFTPSGIGSPIQQQCKIIGISHDWSVEEKRVTFSLEQLDFTLFILDDPDFGVLDRNQLSF